MINLIHENTDFMILYKNHGESFHNESNDGFMKKVKETFPNALPVHRLDKETSGLILVAKNKTAAKELSSLFQDTLVQKTYLAISPKKPKKKQGQVKGDIVKTRNGSYRLARSVENPSYTKFKSMSLTNGHKLFVLNPKTGKTHQLRVVLKSLGAPILGDERYGGESADRMYLHAYRLAFTFRDKDYEFIQMPKIGNMFLENEDEILNLIESL